jgi:hypothetical protein
MRSNELNENVVMTIVFAVLAAAILFIAQILFLIGSLISTGDGQYGGTIVETRHHGIIFKTYGVHFKTGENSSVFEDFCVRDKALFDKVAAIEKDKKVVVTYNKKLSTPSWQCDEGDSSDIITDIKVVS